MSRVLYQCRGEAFDSAREAAVVMEMQQADVHHLLLSTPYTYLCYEQHWHFRLDIRSDQ